MNDVEMARLGMFACLGAFGGLCRIVFHASQGGEIRLPIVLGHMLVGLVFGLTIPLFAAVGEIIIRTLKSENMYAAGGTALLLGFSARSIVTRLDDTLGYLAPQSTYLRKIFGFPKRK